jgi:putative heme iron utilization protein
MMNNSKVVFQPQVSRHSNPNNFSPRDLKLTEIERITESPEYRHSKYLSKQTKNTMVEKTQKEFDEYDVLESPHANTSIEKLQKRGLVVHASGSKKTIN